MFITLLKFSDNKAAASDYMAGHNKWIEAGFADGVFHCVGSIKPGAGGAILMSGEDESEIKKRVNSDPFVQHNVVTAEIIEVDVKKTSAAAEILKA
ncbi:MAG: hypothetical protein MJH10_11210 [Epibacterium sp.]|nr:hypothetical protein [Epibacterium sp.]NQX74115.1 hypothetical protein [Epibacterium sp.]